MNKTTQSRILFHGCAVMLLGMLSGIPWTLVILDHMSGNTGDWKLSHMEGLLNGLLMLAIAACGGLLSISAQQEKILFWCLTFTGYGNALYGWTRGLTGEAGLDFGPPIGNQIAALLGGLPIFTAFVVMAIVMLGARKAVQS